MYYRNRRTRLYRNKRKRKSIFNFQSLFTFILIIITAFYAYQTYILNKITSRQLILSAEPNIELSSEFSIRINNNKFKFILENKSPVDLINIELHSNYYTHLIDDDLDEYFFKRGMTYMGPDSTIDELQMYSSKTIYFDYTKSGLLEKDDQASFFIGSVENPIQIPISEINKYQNTTFAEYTIKYQRKIDSKVFSKYFYYFLTLPDDSLDARLFKTNKEYIISNDREIARFLKIFKK